MTKHIRKCVVSKNHEYEYCSKCQKFDPKETWRNMFCSLNCKKIFNIVMKYKDGIISQDQAFSELADCDLNNLNEFNSDIKNIINQIMY